MTCEQWPVQWPKQIADVDDELKNLAIDAAQELLWARSGGRYGVCSAIEAYRSPDGAACLPTPYKSAFDGEWRNGFASASYSIDLDRQPVRAITWVKINGATVDPDRYYLDGNKLMAVGSPWPTVDESSPPIILVAYTHGVTPPPTAAFAMGELAYEYLQGFLGLACRLPSNATSITRQGVTVTLADPAALAKDGLIGLPLCDAFINSVNPGKLRQRSKVYSPDRPRRA